ncbi:formate dehydrogenase O putative subunit [Corallococcus coralloides DSM 2259]|uniref:Formate dehydrogenase O putative subunit n=1 Tax=Corallococcus coralloides (strain ATCC 25202 / DSM 2259 / NBRC 100086 / M2) TaxID=1144275 RepID=H8MZJ1_CORCM|nr:NrfD/PsrC family molybdoenzyme membrane anchor subunit [Corallococcus coralloides]AFE07886.1 formate dehydrogenase O putative subunit [Corallococcus coralloides DSM 2259]
MSDDTLLDRLQRKADGRNIDPRAGILEGEGSQQKVKDPEPARRGMDVLPTVPSRSGPDSAEAPSYYGMPVLKEPLWIWTVPAYFYVGGVAGAASVLGVTLEYLGGRRLERLAGRCHALATAGDIVSAGLLIHDLGRPSRFLNMLRVFRPTSPMSVGSWVLAGSGAVNTAAFVLRRMPGMLGGVGRAAGVMGAVLGLPLAGYTAVLVSNTAVPLWQQVGRTLPLFFMSSATASAGSLLSLFPHTDAEERVLRRFRIAGKVAELFTREAVELEARQVVEVGKPLRTGASGALWMLSRTCSMAGLVMDVLPGRARWKQVTADVLSTVGAVAARYAVIQAGKTSARNPQATFQGQRQGLGAAQVEGNTEASDGKPLSFPLPVLGQGSAPRAGLPYARFMAT